MIFAKERKIQRKEEGDKLTGVKKEGRSLLLLRLWIHPHLCSCCSNEHSDHGKRNSHFEHWGRANIWIKFQCRNKTLKIMLSEGVGGNSEGGWVGVGGLDGAEWGGEKESVAG